MQNLSTVAKLLCITEVLRTTKGLYILKGPTKGSFLYNNIKDVNQAFKRAFSYVGVIGSIKAFNYAKAWYGCEAA
jgi:hypothetical protein